MQTEVAAISVKHTNVSDAERAAQMGGRALFLMAAACPFCFPALPSSVTPLLSRAGWPEGLVLRDMGP